MHIDAVRDADQHMDAVWAETDAQEAAEQEMARDFIKSCRQRDVMVSVQWAPTTTAYQPGIPYADCPKRLQTLAECMVDSLDYTNTGPSHADAMALILDVAYGADLVNAPAKARALVERMAQTFARYNV